MRSLQRIQPITSPCVTFRNKLFFFTVSSYSPSLKPHAGGPPPVGGPQLVIQYIRSYCSYLEAISSIRIPRTLPSLHAAVRHRVRLKAKIYSTKYAQLTPWNRVLLQTLTVAHLVKKFLTFHETRRFITMFPRPRH